MLIDIVDALLATLPERHRQVIQLRYGVPCGAPKTLERVGQQLGITRQRVRQIEERALKQLRRHEEEIRLVAQPAKEALDLAGGVVRFDRFADEVGKRASESTHTSKGLGGLILKLAPDIDQTRVRGIRFCVLRSYPFTTVHRIHSFCLSILKRSRMGLRLAELADQVVQELREPSVDHEFVASVIKGCPSMGLWDQDWVFHTSHQGTPRRLEVARILRLAGRPLHFTSITEQLNSRIETSSTPRAVHALLGRNPDVFSRTGRGTFGLREWTTQD